LRTRSKWSGSTKRGIGRASTGAINPQVFGLTVPPMLFARADEGIEEVP